MKIQNLFAALPVDRTQESFQTLLQNSFGRLERIVSFGQTTPPGQWAVQQTDEWVLLLKGNAGLLLEGESQPLVLRSGDYLLIPAGTRHRVEWTAADEPTIWLAFHSG